MCGGQRWSYTYGWLALFLCLALDVSISLQCCVSLSSKLFSIMTYSIHDFIVHACVELQSAVENLELDQSKKNEEKEEKLENRKNFDNLFIN